MKLLSWLGRFLKTLAGGFLVCLFGVTAVYALLDDVHDDAAMIAVSFVLVGLGVLLLCSARRDKKRAEAASEEETSYRRAREEKAVERAEKERLEAISFTAVECPGCGASVRVRRGGVENCEYCGTAVEGK